jgi:hypothetical protein
MNVIVEQVAQADLTLMPLSDEIGKARNDLASAHDARKVAADKLAVARATLDRGETWVAAAQARLDALDQEDERIAQAEVERIAAGVRGEDGVAPHAEASLVERMTQRGEAAQSHAIAVRAVERLRGDAERAQGEVNRAGYAIEAAVERLLVIEGEEPAAECQATEKLAATLRHRLGGLSRLWIGRGNGGPPQSIRLGHWSLTVLGSLALNDSRRQHPAAHDPASAALALWQATATALLSNPEAPLPSDED